MNKTGKVSNIPISSVYEITPLYLCIRFFGRQSQAGRRQGPETLPEDKTKSKFFSI